MGNFLGHVLKLVPNKVIRYPGGREIDRFRGIMGTKDDGQPEAWVGSTTPVRTLREGWPKDLGLAKAILPDGSTEYVKTLFENEPVAMLGDEHLKVWGKNAALLVKLLDAQIQLGLQSHPTREYAKEHFNSNFGKEESWYILSIRDDAQVKPYVILGFKEGVTRADFERHYFESDIRGLEGLCHKIYVEPGDMFIVSAGVPHAVGNGCFMIETQEASDITVGTRLLKEGTEEEKRKYDDRLLGCYIYDGANYEDNLKKYRVEKLVINNSAGGRETALLGEGYTDCFSANELAINGEYEYLNNGAFKIGICIDGEGRIFYNEYDMDIRKGDEILIPANVDKLKFKGKLNIVLCDPPKSR